MARPMKPLVRGGGYYPSRKWTPLVYAGGYTTANGGEEPAPPPIEKTVTGNPIHILDALAKPAQALSVKLEPIQDLHGYDNPWPAGGGKNLLTALPSPGTTVWFCEPNGFTFKANQTYCFSIGDGVTVGSYAIYAADKTTQLAYASSNRKVVYTPTVDTVGYPRLYAGEGVSQEAINSAQLELGNSRTTFAPYSNICPISGWTGAKVTRTGKNILPKLAAGTYTANGITATVDSNGLATFSGTAGSSSANLIIPLETQFVYTKKMADNGVYFKLRNSVATSTVSSNFESSGGVSLVDIALTPANRIYNFANQASVGKTAARVRFWISSSFSYNGTYQPSIEWDNVAGPYEPYQGQTYTIDLDGTRYGGTLDVTTGKLTVDRAMVTLTSGMAWQFSAGTQRFFVAVSGAASGSGDAPFYGSCNMFKAGIGIENNAVSYVNTSFYGFAIKYLAANADMTAWKQFLTDNTVNVVYPLATPQTIQLTPTQVELLLGENNLFSDGEMTLVYLADGNASDEEALNILLGGRYVNNHGEDEPTDREALDIVLGGKK